MPLSLVARMPLYILYYIVIELDQCDLKRWVGMAIRASGGAEKEKSGFLNIKLNSKLMKK